MGRNLYVMEKEVEISESLIKMLNGWVKEYFGIEEKIRKGSGWNFRSIDLCFELSNSNLSKGYVFRGPSKENETDYEEKINEAIKRYEQKNAIIANKFIDNSHLLAGFMWRSKNA